MVFVIIDDDADHRLLLERMLSTPESYMSTGGGPRRIRSFARPAEAVADFPDEGPVVVLCDYLMPGCGVQTKTAADGDGLDWLPDFARFDLGPVIVLSSHGDEKIAARAFHAGASDYLTKSAVFKNPQLLHHAVRDGLRRHRLDVNNRRLSEELRRTNADLETKNKRLTELTDNRPPLRRQRRPRVPHAVDRDQGVRLDHPRRAWRAGDARPGGLPRLHRRRHPRPVADGRRLPGHQQAAGEPAACRPQTAPRE